MKKTFCATPGGVPNTLENKVMDYEHAYTVTNHLNYPPKLHPFPCKDHPLAQWLTTF